MDVTDLGQFSVNRWAAIVGHWRFEEVGRAIYEGPQPTERPFGMCVSDVRFLEGEARVTVRAPQEGLVDGRIMLGYRSPTNEYLTVGLGGYGDAYTITQFTLANGWRKVASAGQQENLVPGRDYMVEVHVRGQRIELQVDGIRVLEHLMETPVPYGQLGLFAWGPGVKEFTNASVHKEAGQAFVVMQFSGYEELYKDVVEPVTRSFGLNPYRADEVFGPGNIIEDIIRGIETAQVVIAEITPQNENVFYEVGYAHALGKPTILLADRTKKLPFDLSGRRVLFYDNSIGGKNRVEQGLRKHLEAILDR